MAAADTKTPVTCFTGFLGAGKTTTILGLLKQLPKDYKCVLLKNEYGDVEVDSLLAEQSNITGVSEILNGCLCCTMVGLVDNAMLEIKEKYNPDRIIIESSGSAMPATLALRIREMEPQGFRLDGVVTVVDCKNFPGYEDTSPSAKLQAKYTDLLLLSKHELCTESEMDTLHDRLSALNEDTARIKISKDTPIDPEVLFGLDTQLFAKTHDEGLTWDEIAGKAGWHGDEVETKSVWKGGKRPGSEHKHEHGHADGEACECHDHDHSHGHDHPHANGEANGEASEDNITPISRGVLRKELGKLNFEIYRVKGIVRLPPMGTDSSRGWETYILNWAFGRSDLTRMPALDDEPSLKGVSLRLTVMGERGEVARRAKALAEGLKAEIA